MSETEKKSLFSRLNRTLVLAILGVVTVGTGTLLGLWMTAVEPDNDEGNPASQSESLAGGLRKKHGVREAEPKEFQSLLTENELDFVTDAGAWNETASRTDRIANHVANGDNALRIGDYARAISDYRYVLDMTDGAAEASVRFRLALSSECSGAIQEALDQYQAIAQKFSQSNWNDVAQLGRTRCLAATGQADVLSSVVYRNLSHAVGQTAERHSVSANAGPVGIRHGSQPGTGPAAGTGRGRTRTGWSPGIRAAPENRRSPG